MCSTTWCCHQDRNMKLFKSTVEQWFAQKAWSKDSQSVISTKTHSTSVRSKRSRSSIGSHCSNTMTVFSARLKAEQKRVELEQRAKSLEEQQQINMEKVKHQMKKESQKLK